MTSASRRALLAKHWPGLLGQSWEELCRDAVPRLGNWSTASRWWRGNEPEWDVVAESIDRTKLLVGEVKIQASQRDVDNLLHRPAPAFAGHRTVVRALFAAYTRGQLRAPGALLVGPAGVFRRNKP
jgi:hypothetical protein